MASQVTGWAGQIEDDDGTLHALGSTAYGYCQTAAATAAKVVDMTGFKLVKGATIFVKFQYANSVANPTLNVNGTGAKVIYRYGTTRPSTNASTNSWSAGAVLAFTYDGSAWIEHYWYNNQYTLSNQHQSNGNFTADSAIYRCQLLFHMDEDTLSPLNNADNNTDTSKTMLTTMEFDPFLPIYYYDSTTTVAENGNVTASSCHFQQGAFDLRYSFNCGDSSLTNMKYVYLKCSKQSNGKFRIASASPLTQTLPSAADGYYYILLGRAYSEYQIGLYADKPIYYHNGTEVVQYTQLTTSTTSIGSASTGTAIPADDITAWSAGTLPTLTYDEDEEGIIFTAGTAPSLSYTAKSIPNITVSSKTVVTGIKVTA